MKQSMVALLAWARVHFFRLWTASLILAGFGYCLMNKPEYLTWWKRTTDWLIQSGCGFLPYPWGDRIEATVGNLGATMQIILAIVALRVFLGILIRIYRMTRRR